MAINRELWSEYFSKSKFPSWTCSKCNLGLLEIQKDIFKYKETGGSRSARNHPAWEPDWIKYRFVALLKCNNKNCADSVSLAGRGEVIEFHDENYGHEIEPYLPVFYPEYFYPPPQIFLIPENTPEDIKDEVLNSFSIFLSDTNAAGNRIRTCVEMILDQKKIIKTGMKKERRINLTLHQRIEKFKLKYKELGENLLAIKWLGNAASHPTGLSIDDIFDAFEILQHVLNELYDNRSKRIQKLTKQINSKKGKRSR